MVVGLNYVYNIFKMMSVKLPFKSSKIDNPYY